MSINPRSSKINYQPSYQSGQSKMPYVIIAVLALIIIILVLAGFFYWVGYVRPQQTGVETDQSDVTATTTDQTAQAQDGYSIPLGINVPSDQQQVNPVDSWLDFSFIDKSATTSSTTIKSTTTTSTATTSSPLFQFKYPSFFKVKSSINNIQLTSDQVTSTQIWIMVTTTTKKLDAYLKDADKISATAYEGKPAIEIKSQGQGQIGKFMAVQRIEHMLAADLQRKVTYISLGNKIVTISVISPSIDDTIGKFYDIFLNTFKFKDNK